MNTTVQGQIAIEGKRFPAEMPLTDQAPPISHSVVGPRSSLGSTVERTEALTEAVLARIAAAQEFIYVFGRVEYRDIFNCPRWTTFCFVLGYSRLETFNTCSQWNRIDEQECQAEN